MALKFIYDKQEDIPEKYIELYTERDGKWMLTGVDGLKTPADFTRLDTSLKAERKLRETAEAKLAAWGDLDPEKVHADLDRLPALESAAEGKLDEAKVNELVEKKATALKAPLERDLKKERDANAALAKKVEELTDKDRRRIIGDAVREAATKSLVVNTALDDVLLLAERVFEITEDGRVVTKDGVGVIPSSTPEDWLTEVQPKRPHWWPESKGGGAGGGSGGTHFANNPWSGDHWNITEQGKILQQDPAKAERMAKQVGVSIDRPVRPKSKAA